MTNWKNLINNPPTDDCDICIRVGRNYETYRFRRFNAKTWEISKNGRAIDVVKIPVDALYINLNEILV